MIGALPRAAGRGTLPAARFFKRHTAGCTAMQMVRCRKRCGAGRVTARIQTEKVPGAHGARKQKKGAGRAAARIQAEKAPFSWRVATKNSTFRMACPTKKGAFRKASFFVYIYILHNRRIRIKHFCYLYSNPCIQYMSNVFRRFSCSFFCT